MDFTILNQAIGDGIEGIQAALVSPSSRCRHQARVSTDLNLTADLDDAATVSPSSRCRHQARVSTNSNLTADPDDVRVIPDGVPVEYSRGLGFSKRRLQFLEERIKRLKDYMQGVVEEFMQFSLEVGRRLRKRIKENNDKPRKIEKITRYPDTKIPENSNKQNFSRNLEKKMFPRKPHKSPMRQSTLSSIMSKRTRTARNQASSSCEETIEDRVQRFGLFDNDGEQASYDTLRQRTIHHGDIVNWEYDPLRLGVTFRLGGVERKISLYELGIAWSFGLLTEELVSVLNYEPSPHVYNKKSLINIGAVMELHEGFCVWTATKVVMKEEGDKEDDREGGDQGVGGSANVYRKMSVGDWQARQGQ
ncbi:hypothetical protein Tco_0776634 [Tanacetum coccineum]